MSRSRTFRSMLLASALGYLTASPGVLAAGSQRDGDPSAEVAACGPGPTRLAAAPPPLAYRTSGTPLRTLSWPPMSADGTARVSRDGLEATLRKLQGNQWELLLAARTSQVEDVRFPWWPPGEMAQGKADDWILYISANTGAAASAAEIRRGFGASCDSPGLCVSPILIWATPSEGFLAAGTTWPPRHLRVAAGPDGF